MRTLEDFCTRKDLLDTVLIINESINTFIENQNKINKKLKESVILLCKIDDEETYKKFFDNCNN
ncbi:MAG: hypothetical protein KKC03_13035 [Bacteroidetes bacterium]|nr:hypothetical protein [Bacteroidota bacterium]